MALFALEKSAVAEVLCLAVAIVSLSCGDGEAGESTAASLCGNGVVDPGEVCDDGVNDGQYGGCMPYCQVTGPYCGNRIVDLEEACDDGINDGGYGGCAPDCQAPGPYCGDGVISLNEETYKFGCSGERCDDADPMNELTCRGCSMGASDDMRGCDVDGPPEMSLVVTSAVGMSTLTRAYFAEVYGDSGDRGSITGSVIAFVEPGADPREEGLRFEGPALLFEPVGGSWCVDNGVPANGRWQGTISGARHVIAGESALVDASVVIDGRDEQGRLYGHLEGAVTGNFVAGYCDALILYNEYRPS